MKFPDVNLPVAMSDTAHVHHAPADAWRKANPKFATCPITELGLVRILMQIGADDATAQTHLANLIKNNRAKLIPCDQSADVIAGKVKSHRQTTDAYLSHLAAAHKLTLCTFDGGIKGAEKVKV